ncbi:MAG: hypothetical protein PHG85_07480 [Candidatus Altiarchaeota archaeon]|nr:hypothetical protein [Candidatus Altiarchaeota archaeon]
MVYFGESLNKPVILSSGEACRKLYSREERDYLRKIGQKCGRRVF